MKMAWAGSSSDERTGLREIYTFIGILGNASLGGVLCRKNLIFLLSDSIFDFEKKA